MSASQKEDLNRTVLEHQNRTELIRGKNWLRHSGQCERIDEMLLVGARVEDIASDLIRNRLFTKSFDAALKRVNRHIVHLSKEEHQLPLVRERNGIWRFDVHPLKACEIKSLDVDASVLNDDSEGIKI